MNNNDGRRKVNGHSKDQQLEQYRSDNRGKKMTTNQGLRVSEDEHSLKAGVRGPTLMEDFHFREKMTHFDGVYESKVSSRSVSENTGVCQVLDCRRFQGLG